VTVDVHHENPEVSYPPNQGLRYKGVLLISNRTNDGLKLLISTTIFNHLVTGSIRVDELHPAEFGPATTSFTINTIDISKHIKILIDKGVHEKAKLRLNNVNYKEIEKKP
jgi:hypothetical protein